MPTYISGEGLKKLEEELENRRRETRREIAQRIEGAKELGDLSENFEYHEAKEQQALNESRIIELESMVKDAVLVEQRSGMKEVGLGTTFTVETDGVSKTFAMVGSSEADPVQGKISNESPLGMAFIGRRAGEEVTVEVPSGSIHYRITAIE